ncbi:hypothetical protein [Streptomyces sp. Qhu_M48]|uniref:hypothetical protein n=1 Tax=Streptomyces sp. Qhu_M48 TaxID=3435889 RepID=UPI003F4FF83A
MSGHGGGGARWNDETQSWESDGAAPGPVGGAGDGPAGGVGGVPGGVAGGHVGGAGDGPVVLPPPPPQYTPEPAPGYAPEYAVPGHAPAYVPETGGWRYPVPGSAPATDARPRSRAAVAAGVAVAVLAAGSVGGWLLWGRDGGTPAAGGGPAVSVSDAPETTDTSGTGDPTDSGEPTGTTGPTSGSPTPSGPSATPTAGAPPAGYRVQKDLRGFTIAAPEGWNRTESDEGGVFFNAPDGRSLLQVFIVTEAGMTPYEALRAVSEDGRANKPGYEELSLERVTGDPGAPADAAELVYQYAREEGRRKVVDRAFTAPDGNHYAILAAGPVTDWPKQREVLRVALQFFQPGAY